MKVFVPMATTVLNDMMSLFREERYIQISILLHCMWHEWKKNMVNRKEETAKKKKKIIYLQIFENIMYCSIKKSILHALFAG